MKKLMVVSALSAFALMSCDGGITYSSCVVKTNSDVANSIIPNGGFCYDVDGGGFLLKSDAEAWCEEKVPEAFKNIVGVAQTDMVYSLSRTNCPTQE